MPMSFGFKVPGVTRALKKVLLLDCQSGMCQRKHSRLLSHSFFLPYPCPLDKSQFLQHHSGEGAFIHRWSNPKKRGWRWEPHHQETWSPRGFQSSSSPETTHLLGAVGTVSLQENLPGSEGCGLV